jgi:hypothetical protein
MLKRIGLSFLAAVAGYLVGAFGGGWLVSTFSGASDRSTEAAMTGAFVLWTRRRLCGVRRYTRSDGALAPSVILSQR